MTNLQNLQSLKDSLAQIEMAPYRSHSRVHPIRSFSTSLVQCFIKRDDELSCSISGSKIRKYLSLIPNVKKRGVDQVILIGGASSNNVLGLTQLLIENGLKPVLFLRQAGCDQIRGNRLFIEILVDKSQIHWIDRKEWGHVDLIANRYAEEQEEKGVSSFVIPEGACMEEAIPGALTLALDIVENELENQTTFDHIFIEAGTGLQAIALIMGLNWISHHAHVHVILLADDREKFTEKLTQFSQYFENLPTPTHFEIHVPQIAPSFGSVNSELFDQMINFAKKEGLFLDPIYSAKMFLTGKQIIENDKLQGNVLFVHTGGVFSLSGFQERLQKALAGAYTSAETVN